MWLKCSKGPVKPHDHCSKLQQWLYYGQECNWGIHVCCSCQPGTVSSMCSVCQHQNPLLNTRWASQNGFVTSQNGFVTSPCRGTSPDTKTAYQGQCYPAENKKGKKKKTIQLFCFFINPPVNGCRYICWKAAVCCSGYLSYHDGMHFSWFSESKQVQHQPRWKERGQDQAQTVPCNNIQLINQLKSPPKPLLGFLFLGMKF